MRGGAAACEGEELQSRLFYENKNQFKPINWLIDTRGGAVDLWSCFYLNHSLIFYIVEYLILISDYLGEERHSWQVYWSEITAIIRPVIEAPIIMGISLLGVIEGSGEVLPIDWYNGGVVVGELQLNWREYNSWNTTQMTGIQQFQDNINYRNAMVGIQQRWREYYRSNTTQITGIQHWKYNSDDSNTTVAIKKLMA